MRLLYVSGTYAPGARSGSELSVHTLLRQLTIRHSVDVLVLTDQRYTSGSPGVSEYDGVSLRGVSYDERRAGIEDAIARFQPQVLFTQLNWADEALRVGNQRQIATILRIASAPSGLDLCPPAPTAPTAIVVASRFMAKHTWDSSGRGAHVIPPCVDLVEVRATSRQNPRYITMFNPIEPKGGDLFHELAARLSERKFAVVPGWSVLRDPTGAWDERIWEQSLRSQGLGSYPTPREIDFSDLPNVAVLPPREEVAEIYAETRILCVPSRWNEPFGRVVIEAFANGIPVIATSAGGLQDLAGLAGIIIPRSEGVQAWVRAVEKLDYPDEYLRQAQAGLRVVQERFGFAATVDPFMMLLRTLVPDA